MATKNKRGITGVSNAKAKPWRLNGGGLYPLYMRKIVGPSIAARIGLPPEATRAAIKKAQEERAKGKKS